MKVAPDPHPTLNLAINSLRPIIFALTLMLLMLLMHLWDCMSLDDNVIAQYLNEMG